MWVVTELGEMYSAVNSKDGSKRVVRARDRRSADNLVSFTNERGRGADVEVQVGGGTDYEFRVVCSHEQWEAFMQDRVENAKATNVKSAVAAELGYGHPFLDAMMNTWSVWYMYQEDQLEEVKS